MYRSKKLITPCLKSLTVQSLIRDLMMDLGSGCPYNVKEVYDKDNVAYLKEAEKQVWYMLINAGVEEQHDDDRTYIIDGIEYEIVLRPKGF